MAVDIGSFDALVLTRELVRVLFPVDQTLDPPLASLPGLSPRWNFNTAAGTGVTLSYAFSASAPSYDPGGVTGGTYAALTQGEKDNVENGLAIWSELADVTFTFEANAADADIVFRKADITNPGVAGFAFFPPEGGEVVQNGDVFLDIDGADSLSVVVHELGHALGLSHPFEGGDRPTPEDLGYDGSTLLSIMDYSSPPRDLLLTVTNGGNGFSYAGLPQPQTPMPLDILAAQMLYGANTTTGSGNTVYAFDLDPVFYRTIWDASGIDTIDASNQTRPSLISLLQGSYSTIALRDPMEGLAQQLADGLQGVADRFFNGRDMLAIAFNAVIENALGGSAGDRLIGNGVKNTLTGNAGNDTLSGAAGNDLLAGGAGNDVINGDAGNDTLNGSTGTDSLNGGTGNDTYVIGAGDVLTEAAGAGTDTVSSAISAVLAPNLENLVLTGAAGVSGTGNALVNTLTGNGGANLLKGMAGNDALAGGAGNDTLRGGPGNDTLTGGAGNDFFSFDAALNAGTNTDRIEDFDTVADMIELDRSVFTALGLGALTAAQFRSGAGVNVAGDATDRIIYNTTTGWVYYDADGNGAGSAPVRFATVAGQPALSAGDFLVVA